MSPYELNLQEYEEKLTDLVYRYDGLSDEAYGEMKRLQAELRLSDDIAQACQHSVLELYKKKKEAFEKVLGKVIYQRDNLTIAECERLQKLQPRPHLSDAVVAQTRKRLLKEYQQRKQQFEQTITRLIHEQVYLTSADYHWMEQSQTDPHLSDAVVSQIKRRSVVAYQEKKQQFKAMLTTLLMRHQCISDEDCKKIQQLQSKPHLDDVVIAELKAEVMAAYEHKQLQKQLQQQSAELQESSCSTTIRPNQRQVSMQLATLLVLLGIGIGAAVAWAATQVKRPPILEPLTLPAETQAAEIQSRADQTN